MDCTDKNELETKLATWQASLDQMIEKIVEVEGELHRITKSGFHTKSDAAYAGMAVCFAGAFACVRKLERRIEALRESSEWR